METNLKMEHKRCRCLFPNGKEKKGYIEFVDDAGSVFIRFRDNTYLGLTAEQVKECRK